MPRGIGTSSGVKLTRDRAVDERGEVLGDLGGVPVHAADAVRAGVAHHLAAEQVRLGGLAGAGGAGGGDDDDVGLDEPGRDGRGEARRGDGRVAAGHGDPGRAGAARSRWPGELGQAVGPGAGVRRRRRTCSQAAGSASRKSAPQSMTTVVVAAAAAAIAPDWPCGSARKTTSWPARVSSVVSLEHPVGERHQVRLERAERLAGVGRRRSGRRSRPRGGRAAGAAARRRRTRWLRRPRRASSSCA